MSGIFICFQELIAEQNQAAQTTPKVIPVEIVPSYVWVLPRKNDYALSVKSKVDKKPVLVSHSFEDGGLILHTLEDQLSTVGKIKVALECLAGLTGFADGVLTLTFSDQTATVHFIAAPVQP